MSLLLVIVTLALMGFLCFSFSFEGERASRVASFGKHGGYVLEKTLNKLSLELGGLCKNGLGRTSEKRVTFASHSLSLSRGVMSLCRFGSSPYLLNAGAIFKDESRCDLERTGSFERTLLGNKTSSSSLVSSYVCPRILSPSPISFVMKRNLSLSSSLSTHSSANIFVGGYAEFNELLIGSDLMIVSGGDAFIGRIFTEGSPRISVISATGKVTIGTVIGTPRLNAYGFLGTESTYPLRENGLSPPTREKILIGIK